MNALKVSAYLSIFSPLLFVIGLAFVISQNPWFSFTDNALSAMGSIHNPKNYLFNGFIMLFAIFVFIISLGMFKRFAYLMPLAVMSLFFVGVFPAEYEPHAPAAILFYILAFTDIIIVGIKLGRNGLKVGYLWSVLSIVTLFVMCWIIKAKVFEGLAIPELIGVSTILAWFSYIGLLALRGAEK
ncbi:MAG: DUF998 domain-containing protein [Thermococcus sp.]|nr:DUF998 domain-containing protein [Thermococcus sp.]MBO8175564.1 DUF998 domain-containing protein [Thermococcus sp.]